jgi:hypothetical protein
MLQVWEGYVAPTAAVTSNGESQEASSSGQALEITVTELVDANTFYLQVHIPLSPHSFKSEVRESRRNESSLRSCLVGVHK